MTQDTAPRINPFEDQVPRPSDLDAKIAKAMTGFEGLGMYFAESMRSGLMPVDTAQTSEPDEVIHDETGYTLIGTRLPYWMVLEGTNLTGSSLFSGNIGIESFSRSLLSGTPNNFKTNYHSVDTRKAFEAEITEDRHNIESAYSHESAIGVNGLGKLILLTRNTNFSRYGTDNTMFSGFKVGERALLPSDIFDLDTSKTPEELAGLLQARMDNAILLYKKKLTEEKSKLQFDEPLNRPQGYYEQTRDIIFKDPKHIKIPKKAKGLLRILRR